MPDDAAGEVVIQGMTIVCPQGWVDKSMLVLSAERAGSTGVTPNLVITRETAPDDLPPDPAARLEAFVDRQLDRMRGALAGLTEVARRRAIFALSPAELRIDWMSDDIPITQWITYANLDESTLMIATATAGRNDFEDLELAFRSMLQDFSLM